MLYDRVIGVKVRLAQPPPQTGYRGSLEVNNLRVAFNVTKSLSWSTNTASIQIYNLGENNRNQLNNYGDEIRLFAGYRNNGGSSLLFVGNTTQVSHTFAQPEIISVIDVGDGEKVLNETLVSVSYAAGTAVRTVIESVASQMGLEIADFAETNNFTYATGFKGIDLAKNILDKACKRLNLVWSVQNNNLVILRQNAGSTKPPVDINANTGMIGIPERYTDRRQYLYTALPPNGAPKPGWKVKTLLQPDLLPGDRVRIRSNRANIDGLFYILKITHTGDNFGPVFESNLEVISV